MACPLVRTALDKAFACRSSARLSDKAFVPVARPHGFDTAKPSLSSARPHGFGVNLANCPHGFDTAKLSFPSDTSARLGGPSKALAFPRPRRSCKVQRSPRNDSLLRTVLPLQQLAHVRPAVRARNQADTPPVNPTYRHNRGCRSTELDALARYNAVHVMTRCYGLFYYCNTWLTYDPPYESPTRSTHPWLTTTYRHNQGYRSTNLDRPSSCTQRPAPTIQLYSTTSIDHLAVLNDQHRPPSSTQRSAPTI